MEANLLWYARQTVGFASYDPLQRVGCRGLQPPALYRTVPGTLSCLLVLVALLPWRGPCPPPAIAIHLPVHPSILNACPQSPLSRRAPHRAEQSVEPTLAPGTAYLLARSTAGDDKARTVHVPCPVPRIFLSAHNHGSQERTTLCPDHRRLCGPRRVRFLDSDGGPATAEAKETRSTESMDSMGIGSMGQ